MKADAAMTRNVICIDADDSAIDAWEIMKEWDIRHLPVTNEGKLVGILSDRDVLLMASRNDEGEPQIPNVPVGDAMTRDPITCDTHADLETIGQIMLDEKIDSLPVLSDDGELIGLITSSDLIQLLVDRERVGNAIPFQFKLHRKPRYTAASHHA